MQQETERIQKGEGTRNYSDAFKPQPLSLLPGAAVYSIFKADLLEGGKLNRCYPELQLFI
jgi:hypothetical protein